MSKRREAVFRIPRLRAWFVLPVVLLGLGCGGSKGDVTGKVNYQGKPLPGGTVTFFGSEDRVVGSSQVSTAGDYRMTKVTAGPVRVTVTVPDTIRDPSAPRPSRGGSKKKQMTRKELEEEQRFIIRLNVPTKYRMPDQSGLTYTVQPGKQEHNIDLQ